MGAGCDIKDAVADGHHSYSLRTHLRHSQSRSSRFISRCRLRCCAPSHSVTDFDRAGCLWSRLGGEPQVGRRRRRLAEGSSREMSPGSSQEGRRGAVDDCFLRLVSFSIFGNQKRHTGYAFVLCTYSTSLCVSVVYYVLCAWSKEWLGGTHGVIQGRSLLWLSRHEKSNKLHWICPRAVRRVQATSSMLLCSFWSVGRGQYENTSRMCCGIHTIEVEEETCSAHAKEAFHQQICVFKGKPASKMVRVSQ